MMRNIKTPLGSELIVHDAPDHFEDGVLLTLRILNNHTDSRRVEVLLDQDTLQELHDALEEFKK